MFNKEVIMARLQKGDTPQDIAQEMADLMNAVHKEYVAAEAEKKVKAEAAAKKAEEFQKILEATGEWIVKWYPELSQKDVEAVLASLNIEDLIAEVDAAYKLFKTPITVKKVSTTEADKVLKEFLNFMNW